jgi:hypothetical protein
MSRSGKWLQFEGDFQDGRTALDYHVYFAVEPLAPLYPDDPELQGKMVRAWIRIVVADIYRGGKLVCRTPHADAYHDLDALMRARVQDLTSGMSLVFVRGALEPIPGEGPVVGPLDHPADIEKVIHDFEREHPLTAAP